MKKLSILILLFLSAQMLAAQQTGQSNMYSLNYYLINGAAAGSDSAWQIFTGYRKQWNGISNSPSLAYLGISGRIGKNHGAGLLVEQSKYGLLSDAHAKLSYAYHFALSAGNSLHAGASIGFINRTFQTAKVIASDYSDELLVQNSLTGISILSDVGIMFTSQRLLLGASVPQIIRSNSTENKTGFPGYYVLHGSYDVMRNETWLLQAIAANSKTAQLKSQTDIGARAVWKNQFGGSLGYRTVSGLFLRAEVMLQNRLTFGYGYEHGTTYTGKSHEVMATIRFGRKKKNLSESEATSQVPDSPVQENTAAVADTLATDSVVAKPELKTQVAVVEKVMDEKKVIDRDSVNEIFKSERLIFFKLRSSDKILSENYETSIAMVAKILKENPELNISITGHTCKLGKEDINRKISEDRAREVFNELERRGISPRRMNYIGMGEKEPIDKGDSAEQLARNRRVQIRFTLHQE
jgi:type IX secretion system PorP/SprF family membrane protein